ncbi:uncharacterized protein LOC110095401 [Dendrobium catenatum]|nr:uncharacterized protein LOC110095401 [Dendrobium catenatum]
MEVTLLTSRRKETLMALKVVTIIRIDGEAFETFMDSTLRVADKAIVDAIEAATTSVGGEQGTHSTKTISEVSGTGKKPYKQKGTGRARHGTLRGPQFRGGATMHGPKPRSHAIKLQKKVRRLGLKVALTARAAEGKLLVFEDLAVPSHKTKNIVNYVSLMENTKKVLLVDGGIIDNQLKLATRNLHYVNVLPSIGLNVYSILQHDTLVMTRDAVDKIVTRMHTPINR